MLLSQALRFGPKEIVSLVGAGGKTTVLFRLADELAVQGKRVLMTTTTRMFAAQVEQQQALVLRYPEDALTVSDALAAQAKVILVGERVGDKVAGVPPEFVDQVGQSADAVLVEADGAKMLPFKAPAGHEPVVPRSTTLLIHVLGMSVIGAPLDSAHVHRPEIVAQLAGAHVGDIVTPAMVAQVVTHPEGGRRNLPPGARFAVLLNQVDDTARRSSARMLARLLLSHRVVESVLLAAARQAPQPVLESHRRIAAIVLAGGAGTRMGEQVKQLLPWQGKTFIENAVEIAVKSDVTETVVVLGSRAEEIQPVIRNMPIRFVMNPHWAEGHSTSLRAGLSALSSEIDAALFINADQPKLTTDVVNSVLARYRATDSGIVAVSYAGRRGSPVLFRHNYFAELETLTGEQGGRELLRKYPVAAVDASAEIGVDVDTPEDYAALSG